MEGSQHSLPTFRRHSLCTIKQNAWSIPKLLFPEQFLSKAHPHSLLMLQRGAMPGWAPLPLKCAGLGKHGLWSLLWYGHHGGVQHIPGHQQQEQVGVKVNFCFAFCKLCPCRHLAASTPYIFYDVNTVGNMKCMCKLYACVLKGGICTYFWRWMKLMSATFVFGWLNGWMEVVT